MRIYIKEEEGHKLDIRIPTGLALNRLTAGIAAGMCRKYGVEITKNQLYTLIKVLKDYKKHHPDWKLVELKDGDGDQVEIKI